MPAGLREQALQRARRISPQFTASSTQSPPVSTAHLTPPSAVKQPVTQASDPLSGLFGQFGLDNDQWILLALLIVLYYDHADPKILLAVLYLML